MTEEKTKQHLTLVDSERLEVQASEGAVNVPTEILKDGSVVTLVKGEENAEVISQFPTVLSPDSELAQRDGETMEEYKLRMAEVIAKSIRNSAEGYVTTGGEGSSELVKPTENEAQPLDWWIEMLPEELRENVSKPAWRITGPDTAAWAEERYYEIYTRKKVNDLQAENTIEQLEAEIERVKKRNEERNEPFVRGLNFFGNHLLDYVLRLRQQDDSVKSYKGLYVTLSTRAKAANFEITDEKVFAKWLQDNNKTEWFDLVVKPKKNDIKKGLAYSGETVIDGETGAIVEGVVAKPAIIDASIEIEDETKDGKPVLYPIRQLYVYGTEQ